MMEIWDSVLFANRINISEFNPLDFVSVGVGPLSFNDAYVQTGKLVNCVKGDLQFMAE